MDFIKTYGIDIVNLQETYITENTFSECEFIAQNFDVVYNNAASQFGTCIQISSAIKHENVKMDNYGRVIIYDLPDLNITGGNVYLQSGSSSEDKKCRENYAGMILPQLLLERKENLFCGGDWNNIILKNDCMRLPDTLPIYIQLPLTNLIVQTTPFLILSGHLM